MMNHDDEVMDFFVDVICSLFSTARLVVLTFDDFFSQFDSILILCFHLENKIITFMVSLYLFRLFLTDVVVRS